MPKPSKQKIIDAYKRLTEERGGKPIGLRVFERESGFSHQHWQGGYWRSWSAFQADTGYAPNSATEKTPDEVLLRRFAELALERGGIGGQHT